MIAKAFLKEITIVGGILLVLGLVFYLTANKNTQYILSDSEGYYMYLPALTIYGGFGDIPIKTSQFSKVKTTGNYYNKYTAGVAIMQLPFYTIAAIYARMNKKYAVDGYSRPFQRSVLFAALFYVFSGLFFLYKILRDKFSRVVSIATLLCVFFGTSLFYYTHEAPGMSHAYSFFLWVLLIWNTRKIYSNPSWSNFIILSIVIGLLVFIRPSNVLAALLIAFWDFSSIRDRWQYIKRHFVKYIILPLPLIILIVIQLALWQHMLGETVFFSYNHEPGFIYLASPKIGNVLFHVHNGLFIYAPILVLFFFGLLMGILNGKKNFILFLVILIFATYIFGSWWAWWFGGAYGHRAYVDLLPLLCIPFAFLLQEVLASRYKAIKLATVTACLVLVYYSIRMTRAYSSPWDGPDFGWSEYWSIVRGIIPF